MSDLVALASMRQETSTTVRITIAVVKQEATENRGTHDRTRSGAHRSKCYGHKRIA